MSIKDDTIELWNRLTGKPQARKEAVPQDTQPNSVTGEQEPAQQDTKVAAVTTTAPETGSDEATEEDLVEVRRPIYGTYRDGADFNETAKTWRVCTGYHVSHRPRRPEDGDADVIIEQPVHDPGPGPTVELEEGMDFNTWRKKVLTRGASGVSKADATAVGPGAPDRSFNPNTFRSASDPGFIMNRRNRGAMRHDGSIEE